MQATTFTQEGTMTSTSSAPTLTGYDPDVRLFATRYQQGHRLVYAVDLSLIQIAGLLPAPNPQQPTEGNRRIKESHARAFSEYIREQKDWVAPALVLRAPDIFKFEVTEEIAGTQFGIISFPRMASTDLRILDGQHRILGIHLAIQGITSDLEKYRSQLAAAKRSEALPAVITEFERQIRVLTEQRERFDRERTTIQIYVEDDGVAYKQMFFDIAENALGITSSVRARFDSRKVVNRSMEDVMKHSLLRGRVDQEQDRMGRNNPNLVGAKHVAEIVRTLAVGIEGRIGRRLEDELREDALVQLSSDFLDALLSGFPSLAAVADNEMTAEELRKTSLLGSTTVLRVLAGVYYQLTEVQKFDEEDVAEFFTKLAPHTTAPIDVDSIWVKYVPDDIFVAGASAPRARRQDLKALRDAIVDWAIKDPSWLSSPVAITASA
jgi:hypothetical protein